MNELQINQITNRIIVMNIKKPAQLVISNIIGLFLSTLVLEGFYVEPKVIVFILGGIFLMLGQLIVRPILKFISFPINMASLGLFNIVINAIVLFLVVYFTNGISITSGYIIVTFPFVGDLLPNIEVDKWITLLIGAFLIDLVGWLMKKLVY